MTFVIIGAGFTGIELACELRQRIRVHASADVADSARVVLIEREPVAGPQLGPGPRPVIEEALQNARVEVLLKTQVIRINDDGIELEGGTSIAAKPPSPPPGYAPIASPKRSMYRWTRSVAFPHLRITDRPGWYATGDVACAYAEGEHVALMSCQHAMTMGKFAGANVARDLCGQPLLTYQQPNYQTCLDLGDYGAVLTRGWQRDVLKSGREAKPIKVFINQKVIYPPIDDHAALLAASASPI